MMEELRQMMQNGAVTFQYKKKDGSTRTATGTLCESIIVEDGGSMPKGTGVIPQDTFPYWDLNSNGWRCFKTEYFISII